MFNGEQKKVVGRVINNSGYDRTSGDVGNYLSDSDHNIDVVLVCHFNVTIISLIILYVVNMFTNTNNYTLY